MCFRLLLCAIGLTTCLFGGGCGKPAGARPPSTPTVLSPDTVVSVHWMGKHWMGLDAGAYYFSRVWGLPESARLESQTLDRLSAGFWRYFLGNARGAQVPRAVLEPLFQEATRAESYLEIRANPDTGFSAVLATRLDKIYAGAWETNLAIAAELLTGAAATPNPAAPGWTLPLTNSSRVLSFKRVGRWGVLALGPRTNALADEISARLAQTDEAFVSAGSNLWLEASVHPTRLATVFPAAFARFKFPATDLAALHLAISGDGADVITRAELTLASPFSNSLTAWQLPLPLMHEPLTSFTAARDLPPELADFAGWGKISGGALPPDQLFLWSLAGSPYQVYLAAPLPDAQSRVAALSDALIQNGNPWLAAHGYISFDRAADGNGVTWGHLPDIRPFIKSAGDDANGWLYAGLFPDQPTNAVAPPPAGMIQDLLRRTNLVYYDWEVTGLRLQPCLKLAQTARLVARRPQLPENCASLAWLATLDPRLRTSATIINRVGTNELTFYRRSTLGLTAPELQWLTGWLESPDFP